MAVPAGGISVGGVLARATAAVGGNPATFFGTSFLFGALPSIVFNRIQFAIGLPGGRDHFTIAGYVSLVLLFSLAGLFFSMLVTGALAQATVAHSRGERLGIGGAVADGARHAFPLLGLTIIITFGCSFATMLLLVPGIILYILWSVAVPALVAEDVGVFGSLTRSRQLTKGARWSVFAVQLLLLVALMVAMSAFWLPMRAAMGNQMFTTMQRQDFPVIFLVAQVIISTILTTVWSAVQAALYVELVHWKDGAAPDRLADVFA